MTDESSSNISSSSATYPKKIKLSLALELELRDSAHESYILAAGAESNLETTPTLQLGFIADLFDIFNFESSLGVEKINGFTQAQVTKTLQAGL